MAVEHSLRRRTPIQKAPRTTAYSDTGTLVDLGVLTRDEAEKTHLHSHLDYAHGQPRWRYVYDHADAHRGDRPVALRSGSRFANWKHGIGKLAAALTYAIPYVEGEMTERVAARELGLHPAFGIAVLQALREVILDMQEIDPYFDQIRNAHDEPSDEET